MQHGLQARGDPIFVAKAIIS